MLFPMLPGAKSYDQPIASYVAFKLGVTLFFDHPVDIFRKDEFRSKKKTVCGEFVCNI